MVSTESRLWLDTRKNNVEKETGDVSTVMAKATAIMTAARLQQTRAAPWWLQTSLYCDCPGGVCVSSSWPCPSGDNHGCNVGLVALNGQGQDQDQGQTANVVR